MLPWHLGLPVLLVVGMRLGCISHALLTADAIRARQLTLAGWIANPIDPDFMPETPTSPPMWTHWTDACRRRACSYCDSLT